MYNVLLTKANETWGLSFDKKRNEILFRSSNFVNFETKEEAAKALKEYTKNLKSKTVAFNSKECIIKEI